MLPASLDGKTDIQLAVQLSDDEEEEKEKEKKYVEKYCDEVIQNKRKIKKGSTETMQRN